MAEPTLQEVFGANATQDVNSITIDKSDLTALTASATNTAESLLTAITLKAIDYLNQTNFDNNLDQSILVELGLSSFLTRGPNNDNYRTDQITVTLAKLDTNGIIDPDNY
mgnify:FL=1